MKVIRVVLFLALALQFSSALRADVRLPHVLSNHVVLQRDRPIHIWGWATPGANLSVHFRQQTVRAQADQLGKWSVWLAPEPAGGPYALSISGDGPVVTLSDILVGDVWIASGQSNMEFPLKGFPGAPMNNSQQEIAAATNPRLRLLLVDEKSSDVPLNDEPSTWTLCTPETAANFSAVAYFFGREIAAREKVPVGLIDSTWGGTPADSWVSMDTLGNNAQLLPAFASRAQFADQLTDVDAQIAAEKREDEAARAAGQPVPHHPWHPAEVSWSPAGLYNGMIAPLTPLEIRGFIWYQGETNSGPGRAPYYATLFPALIGGWRTHFSQGNLPFFFVQISSFSSPAEDWGRIRDAQRRTLSLARTGMAVTIDIGEADNVHPPDKQTVGARLALAARHIVYGENIAWASPLFRQVTSELQPDGTTVLRVWFDHAQGLTARGKPIDAFEIAGEDRHFIPAVARIEGETVVVSSPALPHPVYVRYGWMGVVPHDLYNAAGLPMSTFTSENWPGQ